MNTQEKRHLQIQEKAVREAWAKIRTIDHTIPDEVLDYMKDAALAYPHLVEALKAVRVLHLDKYEEGTVGYRVHKAIEAALKEAGE